LADLLPNALVRVDPQTSKALTDLVVVGHVAAVSPGAGYAVEGEDAPSGALVPFDSDQAMWRTVHLRFSVETVVGGKVESNSVNISLAVGGSMTMDRIKESLLGPRLVLFLYRGSPVFQEDPSLLAVVANGNTIVTVDNSGRLDLPAWPERADVTDLLRGVETLDLLDHAADQPLHEVATTPVS